MCPIVPLDTAKEASHRVWRQIWGGVQSAALLTMGLALGVAAIELACRVFNLIPEGRPAEFEKYLPAQIAAYTYAHAHAFYPPHSSVPIYADGKIAQGQVDDFGYLGTGEPTARECEMLVFGDSFAYGFGVDGDKAFAARLRAYNAGLWGETFPTHATVLGRVAPRVRPRKAIWVLYPPHIISCTPMGWYTRTNIDTHRYPVLGWLLERLNRLKLSTLILKATGWGYNRSDYYSLEWTLYDPAESGNDGAYEIFDKAVEEVVRLAREQRIELYTVFIPSKTQIALDLESARPLRLHWRHLEADQPVRRMAHILASHGIDPARQFDLMDVFRKEPAAWRRNYFVSDAHLNEAGHVAAAEFLGERLHFRTGNTAEPPAGP